MLLLWHFLDVVDSEPFEDAIIEDDPRAGFVNNVTRVPTLDLVEWCVGVDAILMKDACIIQAFIGCVHGFVVAWPVDE